MKGCLFVFLSFGSFTSIELNIIQLDLVQIDIISVFKIQDREDKYQQIIYELSFHIFQRLLKL